jgi:RsiW-degrading membrane proteinase PrsW (M82 family)
MSGLLILLVSVLISSFPLFLIYIWFRAAKYQFTLAWFLLAALTGATAFFPALLLQELFSVSAFTGRAALFFDIFIRVAFTEEISRLLMFFIFLWISNKNTEKPLAFNAEKKGNTNEVSRGTAAGLVAGLGFAILESARYTVSSFDISIVFLRLFTAALHGACGSRIGAAAVLLTSNTGQAFLRIFTAIAIHGVFNFLVTIPGMPLIAAFLIALSAMSTTIIMIRGGWNSAEYSAIDKTVKRS